MKSEKRHVFINSLMASSASFFEKVVFFVITIFIARYLNRIEYGEYTAALAFATLFSVLTNIGISNALVRAINLEPGKKHSLEAKHLGNTILLKSVLALFIYGLMVLVLVTLFDHLNFQLVIIFGLVRFGNQYLMTFYAFYEAKERFSVPALFIISFSIAFFGATIVVIFLNGNYFHFAYSRLFVVLIFLLIVIYITRKKFTIEYDLSRIRSLISTAVPFGIHSICNNFLQRFAVIIISAVLSEEMSGVFNNGFMFFITLGIVPISLQKILVPYLYKLPFNDNKKKFQFTFDIFHKTLSIISFYLLMIYFVFSEIIIGIVFGDKYNDSLGVLKILAFAIPFYFSISPAIIIALDKQKVNTIILTTASLINISLLPILLTKFNIEGAAYITVITYAYMYIVSNIYLAIRRYVNLRTFSVILIKSTIIAIICYLIYNSVLCELWWFVSFIVISIIYIFFVFILIVQKHDIEILRGILNINKSKNNYK